MIVLLTNRIPPEVDGVGDYTGYLAAELARQGQPTHIICRNQAKIAAPLDVPVHSIVGHWHKKSNAPVLALLQKIRPEWLVLQYVPYAFHPLGLPFFLPKLLHAIRRTGVRTCVVFHEVHIRTHGAKAWIIGNLQRRIARQLCRHAEAVVTSNDFYKRLLTPFHPHIHVIPVGANIEVVPVAVAERQRLRRQMFPDKSIVVATFGRRDISALVAAAETMEDVGVLAIGGDRQVSKTRKVCYTGHLPAADVGALLSCADMFVLPDPVSPNGEGGTCTKSGSLAAAFAVGLPVIGVRGDMTGPPLRHGENIWLVERGDTQNLRDAIRKLCSDPAVYARLQTNGAALYRKQMAWNVLAAAYQDIFQKPVQP